MFSDCGEIWDNHTFAEIALDKAKVIAEDLEEEFFMFGVEKIQKDIYMFLGQYTRNQTKFGILLDYLKELRDLNADLLKILNEKRSPSLCGNTDERDPNKPIDSITSTEDKINGPH